MKKNSYSHYLIILLLICFSISICKSQSLRWVHGFGDHSYSIGTSVVHDPMGNSVVTGYFRGSVDFDPGPGSHVLSDGGSNRSFFLAKYDPSGNYLWAINVQFSGNTFDAFHATIDPQQNIIVTGIFNGTADFNPGTGIANLSSIGFQDIFVAKYDPNGNYLWAKNFGAIGNGSGGNNITCDSKNIYVVGFFTGTVDFDPGGGTFFLSAAPNTSMFVLKLSYAGNFLNAFMINSSNGGMGGTCIGIDSDNQLLISGSFNGTADFDPGAGTFSLTSASTNNPFLMKMDTAFNFNWALNLIETSQYTNGNQFSTDHSGNIYFACSLAGSGDADPGPGIFPLTTTGSTDISISKIDSSGNFQWAKNFGSPGEYSGGLSCSVDDSDDVYVTGYFRGTIDFDPGAGVATLAGGSGLNAFVLKLDANANYQYAFNFKEAVGFSIDVHAPDVFALTGHYDSPNVDFDPSPTISSLSASGITDCFLALYGVPVVGIASPENATIPAIYPNPSQGTFTLKTNTDESKMEILSLTGQRLHSQLLSDFTNLIRLPDMEEGVYLLAVTENEKKRYIRLVIQK